MQGDRVLWLCYNKPIYDPKAGRRTTITEQDAKWLLSTLIMAIS